jgi:hypothetical protein
MERLIIQLHQMGFSRLKIVEVLHVEHGPQIGTDQCEEFEKLAQANDDMQVRISRKIVEW